MGSMKNTRTSVSVATFTDAVEGEGWVVQGGSGSVGVWGMGCVGES
jgi:hypothetical protein